MVGSSGTILIIVAPTSRTTGEGVVEGARAYVKCACRTVTTRRSERRQRCGTPVVRKVEGMKEERASLPTGSATGHQKCMYRRNQGVEGGWRSAWVGQGAKCLRGRKGGATMAGVAACAVRGSNRYGPREPTKCLLGSRRCWWGQERGSPTRQNCRYGLN